MRPFQIPKFCRRARSRRVRGSRRQGLVELSCKDHSSSTTTASTDQRSDVPIPGDKEEVPEFSLFRCSMPWNEKTRGVNLKSIEVSITDDVSISDKTSLGSPNNRSTGLQLSDHASVDFTDKLTLPAAGCINAWLAPGNVVWAKTAYHEWWPAEVMDERCVLECSSNQHSGHVLVQLYGNNEYTWLDPIGDLSQFNHCYGERSKNPLKAFQDALKQALCKHAHTSTRTPSDRSSVELESPTQQDKPSVETWNTPSSSRTKDDNDEEGRGRRKRKAKAHFDELTFPKNPTRKTRRLKIMRRLGLIAPVGSPFAYSHERTI